MDIQPAPLTDETIAPADDSPQPISIRKLDRVETTHQSSFNGG
jgi:hypothetical protein